MRASMLHWPEHAVRNLAGHADTLLCGSVVGDLAATGSTDGIVLVFDVCSGRCLYTLEPATKVREAVAGSWLASCAACVEEGREKEWRG
jgi:hypothetical protein